MKERICILIFCSLLSGIACTTGPGVSGDYVIRYINLNTIYEYIYNNSNEAQVMKRNIDSLLKKINEMETSDNPVSKIELNHYKNELSKLREQEKAFKSASFLKIKTAVDNVAAKHNTDFILNSGDGVVYSRPVYDLTYEVIKELQSLNRRTSPVYK